MLIWIIGRGDGCESLEDRGEGQNCCEKVFERAVKVCVWEQSMS